MSGKNSSGKTVPVAQNENESGDEGREQGALYGEASDVQGVRDAERMRQYDEVNYPSEGRDVEFELSIDGVPGDEIGQKRAEQGRLDRGTDEAVNGSWGGPGGESEYDDKSLYTQERIEAREDELAKISTRAGANPEVHPRPEDKREREERTMDLHQTRMEECREEVEAQAASGIVARGYVTDAREHMAQETVGDIYTQSQRVAERFDQPEVTVAKRLAEKVGMGQSVSEGVMNLVEELCDDRTVVTPMKMVEPTDSWGTIEGVVTRLFDPSTSNQQQVVIVEDESGSAKLTIWRNSNRDVRLNKGDVIRVIDGKPGGYGGQLTLAATSDTQIWVREKGDGPSPMGGVDIAEPSPSTGTIDEDAPSYMVTTTRNNCEQWLFPVAADMPNTEDVDVDLGSFEGSEERSNITQVEAGDSDTTGFVAVSEQTSETFGVSWGEQVRQEAEQEGRQKRIDERKYNVPDWKRTTSRINHYEHTSISEFGANERMVHLDLPALSNDE
jgi:hypothetical protein